MTTCPQCGLNASRVVESRISLQGQRRRRWECELCGHRWTTSEDVVGEPSRRKHRRKRGDVIGEDDVRLVLTRPELTNKAAAALIGCSSEAVRRIRNGTLHSGILPQLLRPSDSRPRPETTGPSCDKCGNWTGAKCDFGFPDPLLEGLLFASNCDLYAP